MHWLSEGKRDSDIAAILKLSVRTVEQHVHTCLQKLGVAAEVWRARNGAGGVAAHRQLQRNTQSVALAPAALVFSALNECTMKKPTAMQMHASATLKAGQGFASGTWRLKSRKSITAP